MDREGRQVKVGGQFAETGDGLSIEGLDFTHRPGVAAARVVAEAVAGDPGLILEEAPEPVAEVPAGPTAADLAAMPSENFEAAATAYWGGRLAAGDGRSPFWRGLGGGDAA